MKLALAVAAVVAVVGYIFRAKLGGAFTASPVAWAPPTVRARPKG